MGLKRKYKKPGHRRSNPFNAQCLQKEIGTTVTENVSPLNFPPSKWMILEERIEKLEMRVAHLEQNPTLNSKENEMPKIHPREREVSKAQNEISEALFEIADRYDLTYGEYALILGDMMNANTRAYIKYERQEEA